MFTIVLFFAIVRFVGVLAASPYLTRSGLTPLMSQSNDNVTNLRPLFAIPASVPWTPISPPNVDTTNPNAPPPDFQKYRVPKSPVTLMISYFPDRPLNLTLLGGYLREMQLQFIEHINAHGDSPLSDYHDDPYRRTGVGFYFIASSVPEAVRQSANQEFTYEILMDVVTGLIDVMYIGGKDQGCYVRVLHDTYGFVGTVVILPEKPGGPGTAFS